MAGDVQRLIADQIPAGDYRQDNEAVAADILTALRKAGYRVVPASVVPKYGALVQTVSSLRTAADSIDAKELSDLLGPAAAATATEQLMNLAVSVLDVDVDALQAMTE